MAKGNRTKIAEVAERLGPLVQELQRAGSWNERLDFLNAQPDVKDFLASSCPLNTYLASVSIECEVVLKSVIAIGQVSLLAPTVWPSDWMIRLRLLVEQLIAVEKFYWEIGGIVGYHWMVLQFLDSEKKSHTSSKRVTYYPAEGIDLSQETGFVREAVSWGIEMLPKMAEIYPLGGAGDRLRLYDEKTGMPLPAARLEFAGKTLLEGLIADLQAREYLHFKLYHQRLCTPIAIMTSPEKDNHAHILAICEEAAWFGRPKESFRFFCQPLVPTLNSQGDWCSVGPCKLLMKPGGHGVIWRLARDEGIFSWLRQQERSKALVRQINNPMAGIDLGLLAFTGIGCRQDKVFGFASCHRQVKASEGVNVLIEREREEGVEYVLTNIEYCDFKRYDIIDEPVEVGSAYSKFSSNTNILFADLQAVEEVSERHPMPGLLINLKKTFYRLESGRGKEELLTRLESTMQNIADYFGELVDEPIPEGLRSDFETFVTFNQRRKTISTAKREFTLGSSLLETPEACFLDLLHNAYDLLAHHCGMRVPKVQDPLEFFVQGPSFVFFYHPALGPIYHVIAQKIRGGTLKKGSELQLEIAELSMENLDLEGTLLIKARAPMGDCDEAGILHYSESSGKCRLKGVKICNLGIDWEAHHVFWRNEIQRKESCTITLHGSAEFEAYDVTLSGDFHIEVPDGHRLVVRQGEKGLEWTKERIKTSTWSWKYTLDSDKKVDLSLLEGAPLLDLELQATK